MYGLLDAAFIIFAQKKTRLREETPKKLSKT